MTAGNFFDEWSGDQCDETLGTKVENENLLDSLEWNPTLWRFPESHNDLSRFYCPLNEVRKLLLESNIESELLAHGDLETKDILSHVSIKPPQCWNLKIQHILDKYESDRNCEENNDVHNTHRLERKVQHQTSPRTRSTLENSFLNFGVQHQISSRIKSIRGKDTLNFEVPEKLRAIRKTEACLQCWQYKARHGSNGQSCYCMIRNERLHNLVTRFRDDSTPRPDLHPESPVPIKSFLNEERILQWQHEADNLLWICGRPGSGKSIMTSLIVDTLKTCRNSGDYIVAYCGDAKHNEMDTAVAVLRETLFNLLHRDSTGEKSVLRPILQDLILWRQSLSPTRLRCIVSNIKHSLARDEMLYLILDGVDGAEGSTLRENPLQELIKAFLHQEPGHRIKVFLSARPSFFTSGIPQNSIKLDLSEAQHKDGLELYVSDYLRTWDISRLTDFGYTVEQLVEQAGGSFLHAQLILEFTRTLPYHKSPAMTIEEYWAFSGSASDIYEKMLGQITETNRRLALSALRWATFACRPLHVQELVSALKLEIGIETSGSHICNVSAGLLVVRGSHTVQLVHHTLREYLHSHMEASWGEVSAEAHEIIASTCLKVLSPDFLLQSLGLPHRKGVSNPDIDFSGQSLANYALFHWQDHYRIAESQSTFLAGQLHGLLKSSLGQQSQLYGTGSPDIDKNGRQRREVPRPSNISPLEVINTALTVGATHGFLKLVKLELEMGANADFLTGHQRLTPLCLASSAGHLETVEILLQYGANQDLSSVYGQTPLHFAIAQGNNQVVRSLLFCGKEQSQLPYSNTISASPMQTLSLSSVCLSDCTNCGAKEMGYRLSKLKTEDCQDQEEWTIHSSGQEGFVPSIIVKGAFVHTSDLNDDIATQEYTSPLTPTKEGPITVVNWFSGMAMYKALEIAAKRGIEEIVNLLALAGNDMEFLTRTLSLSSQFSSLSITSGGHN